jgi:hypothetical protein
MSPIRGIRPKAILCLSETSGIAQEIETYKYIKYFLLPTPLSSTKLGRGANSQLAGYIVKR